MSAPNTLILADDQQRYDTVGANGSAICRTPNQDRLAREGVSFSHAFTCTAICSSARSALLTGRYPHNGGLMNNTHERDALALEMPDGTRTYAQHLREAGYRSAYIGKWHAGRDKTPTDWGYDFYNPDGFLGPVRDRLGIAGNPPVSGPSGFALAPWWNIPAHGRRDIPVEACVEHTLAEAAMQFIRDYEEQRRRDGRPWHVRVDWQAPHWPHYLPEPYFSMYDPKDIPPWPNFGDAFEAKPYANNRLVEQWRVGNIGWPEWAELVARYFGHVSMVDRGMGLVLDALDETGAAENTLVIFTTDHGDMTGSHGIFNKGGVPYEEIYHIPMVIRWPGVAQPGRVCDRFVMIQDFFPTILDAAGCAFEDTDESASLLPLVRGEESGWRRDAAFCAYYADEVGMHELRILRNRRYKFVYNVVDRNELYDLEEDPHELHNLFCDPAHADVRREMGREMLSWMERTDDRIARWSRTILVE